jgi:alpha-tubulin suppressor-like RCC1 family protein
VRVVLLALGCLSVAVVAGPGVVPPAGSAFTSTTGTSVSFSAAASFGGGQLAAWGRTTDGAVGAVLLDSSTSTPVRVPSVRTWSLASAGIYHTCAITTAGHVYCWGGNSWGELGDGTTTARAGATQVGSATDWTQVAAGGNATCGLRGTVAGGTAWCWGGNWTGELGDGTTTNSQVPVQVGAATDWTAITAGTHFACGIRGAGAPSTLWCWGYGQNGQLGNGGTANASTPQQVAGTGWSEVSAGVAHACAVHVDGTLVCWGVGGSGQLGDGAAADSSTPVSVAGNTWASVSAGKNHTCATKSDHTIWCWGANASGQAGDSSTTQRNTPVQAGTATTFTTVAVGGDTSCGLLTDGTRWCWGDNDLGEIGDGTTISRSSPVQSGSMATWTTLTLGDSAACGVAASGGLWCSGSGGNGTGRQQLGDGTTQWDPAAVSAGASWTSASAGTWSGCGVRLDASLWCWGFNGQGQLGLGDVTTRPYPVQVVGATWSQVSVGEVHACGVHVDGTLWCWGGGWNGQLGQGDWADHTSPVPVSAGATFSQVASGVDHTCAIASGGTAPAGSLWCWGADGHGQLGDAGFATMLSPERIGTATDWTSVVAGAYATCGIRADGSLWCWGAGTEGQLGIATTTDQANPTQVPGTWLRVSVGAAHACGVTTAHTLFCWGRNITGQLGDGTTTERDSPVAISPGVTTWTTIATGADFTCSTRSDGTVWCWGANTDGQLGSGDLTQRTSPTQVPELTTQTVAAAGNATWMTAVNG